MASQFALPDRSVTTRRLIAIVALVVATVALAVLALNHAGRPRESRTPLPGQAGGSIVRPPSPVPAVEPLELDASNPDEARKLNAAIPFSTAPNPAAKPFHFIGDSTALDRATDCMAAAMLYEAGDNPLGERAVGQVVLNRLRHPAFPKTVCGVVFQGQERTTGCQFTFTCDGALGRQPSSLAWERARMLASGMLAGDVFKPIGYSTHYHTDWVMPFWSGSLDKVAAVDTHLFFRWQGWWGTPPAFLGTVSIAAEPVIQKLAQLSPAHRPGGAAPGLQAAATLIDDSRAPNAIGPEWIGRRIGPGKLVAVEPGGNGFVMTVDKGGDPARYAEAAQSLCAGRAQCRLLAWTDPAATPKSFPVTEAAQPSMSFSYIRIKDSNLERILYNCAEFPATPRIQCMVRRAAVSGAAPKLAADEQAEKAHLKIDGLKPAPVPTAAEADRPKLKADLTLASGKAKDPS